MVSLLKIRDDKGNIISVPFVQGPPGVSPHVDALTGNWFIGNNDTGVKATGAKGIDGLTPSIGLNGNWFIGDTDTGVKAQGPDGQSNLVIKLVTLTASKWDASTFTQTIPVEGVLADDLKQVITIEPLPDNAEAYEAAGISCMLQAEDSLTFETKSVPEGDISVYIILETTSDANSEVSNNVYSTEEAVVGTWIDGKPIYRRCYVGIAPETTGTAESATTTSFSSGIVNIDNVVKLDAMVRSDTIFTSLTSLTNAGIGVLKVHYLRSTDSINIANLKMTGYNSCPVFITCEYTKTTDAATVEIPSITALAESYEQGVNES